MERRQFTREFRLEAVRLIRQRGVSYAQASIDLGVHPTQLRNWVKQLADDPQHAFPGQGLRAYLRQPERLVEYAAAHIQHMQKALMELAAVHEANP